uniref:Uncharacterized protein n=1 Tax=Mola mola TaxID=94237 RepID=A0A3Q4BU04_MOLML
MSEVAIVDPVLPSTTCTSIAPKPVTPGTKRAREMGLDSQNSVPGVDHEWENLPEAAAWHKQSSSHPPSQKFEEQFEELNPPQSKRRLIATSSLSCDSQLSLKAWSQDPLFTYSQYSECDLENQQNTTAKDFHDFEPPLFNSPQNGEVFGLHLDVEATTSTRKSFKGIISSLMDDEKENRFLSPKSPSKHSTHSDIEPRSTLSGPHQKTVSPRKNFPVHLQKMADKGHSCDSQFIWTKPRHSPIKQQQLSLRAVDEDSLATLFTQDSEGFRVIAHRGVHERSPLKDQTSNVSTWMVRAAAYKSVVEENVEDEMLFTQDSQGNLQA